MLLKISWNFVGRDDAWCTKCCATKEESISIFKIWYFITKETDDVLVKKRVTCNSKQLLIGIEDFIWLELARFCCPKPQADGNRSFKGQTKLLLYSSPVYKIFVINRQFFQNCFIPLTTIFTFVKSENQEDVIYYTFVIVTSKCRDCLKQWN